MPICMGTVGDVKLTLKQKKFCEEYIKSGNATEAARNAGYRAKSARAIGAENLTKPAIADYIRQRLNELDAKMVADANEILKFYTSVMRGEVKDQFGLESSLSDRLKAADSLSKRLAAAEGKPSGDTAVKVIIDV